MRSAQQSLLPRRNCSSGREIIANPAKWNFYYARSEAKALLKGFLPLRWAWIIEKLEVSPFCFAQLRRYSKENNFSSRIKSLNSTLETLTAFRLGESHKFMLLCLRFCLLGSTDNANSDSRLGAPLLRITPRAPSTFVIAGLTSRNKLSKDRSKNIYFYAICFW